MKLEFRGDKTLVGQALRSKAELRVGLLLGRFAEEIDKVTLRLSSAAGNNGNPHKRCQIAVGIKPKRVLVEHTDADLSVALDRAADKAVRSIARALEQEGARKVPALARVVR
jgi:ribosome-associated translation inhibitor RaiA